MFVRMRVVWFESFKRFVCFCLAKSRKLVVYEDDCHLASYYSFANNGGSLTCTGHKGFLKGQCPDYAHART